MCLSENGVYRRNSKLSIGKIFKGITDLEVALIFSENPMCHGQNIDIMIYIYIWMIVMYIGIYHGIYWPYIYIYIVMIYWMIYIYIYISWYSDDILWCILDGCIWDILGYGHLTWMGFLLHLLRILGVMIPLYHEFKILGRIINIFVFKYHQVILPYYILYIYYLWYMYLTYSVIDS